MDETKLLTELSMPKSTWFLRNLPFNQLSKRLTASQKKLILEVIQSYGIRVLATIKPSNTNIATYEDTHYKYEEIHIYAIEMAQWKKQKDIFLIFAQIIPYPLLILFHQDNKKQWMAAKYHRNTDQVHLVVDGLFPSKKEIAIEKYNKALNFEKMSKMHLKDFYESIVKVFGDVELKESYGIENNQVDTKEYLTKLNIIDGEIKKIQKIAKKESQMNHRISLNMKMQQLKKDKENILKEMNK